MNCLFSMVVSHIVFFFTGRIHLREMFELFQLGTLNQFVYGEAKTLHIAKPKSFPSYCISNPLLNLNLDRL